MKVSKWWTCIYTSTRCVFGFGIDLKLYKILMQQTGTHEPQSCHGVLLNLLMEACLTSLKVSVHWCFLLIWIFSTIMKWYTDPCFRGKEGEKTHVIIHATVLDQSENSIAILGSGDPSTSWCHHYDIII